MPAGTIDDLALFNGSISVNRTAGELTVRCGNEALNFLALNLANDIVVQRRTVEQARREFARLVAAYAAGETHRYLDSLAFRIPAAETADPDRPLGGSP